MKIFAVILILATTAFAAENNAPFCRYPTESKVEDHYLMVVPKGDCELISLEVLTAKECKKFVKVKVGECYQLGKIYDQSEPEAKPYTTCFSCKPN